jgi:hypothetical protein
MKLTRRGLLRLAMLSGGAAVLGACAPLPVRLAADAPVPAAPVPTPPAPAPVRTLPHLDLRLFGPFHVYRDGLLVSSPRRRVDAAHGLLALLLLHRQPLDPMAIGDVLWPNMAPSAVGHSVQMAAYTLRRLLGAKATVQYQARTYRLNPELEPVVDVWQFDAALSRARGADRATQITSLVQALQLYGGPLLPDASYAWLGPVRSDYHTRYLAAARQLGHTSSWTTSDITPGLRFDRRSTGSVPRRLPLPGQGPAAV